MNHHSINEFPIAAHAGIEQAMIEGPETGAEASRRVRPERKRRVANGKD